MVKSIYEKVMGRYFEINLEDKLHRLSFQDPEIILSKEEVKYIRQCYHIKCEGFKELADDYLSRYMSWRQDHIRKIIETIYKN